MAKGSCMCGDFTYEFSGEPWTTSVCHCIPCQKLSGTKGSVHTVIQNDQFKQLSGTNKSYTRTWSDSGKPAYYTSCDKCSTVVYVEASTAPGMIIIRTGTIDEPQSILYAVPKVEIYNKHRPGWCDAVNDATQMNGPYEH